MHIKTLNLHAEKLNKKIKNLSQFSDFYKDMECLNDFEIKKIIKSTKKILNQAIKSGGSSIKDFSSDNGKQGVFQQKFKVYGLKGESCSNIDCNKIITKLNISNRSSFFCKSCQK